MVLIDTSSLLSLAVHPDMWSCAKSHFEGRVGTSPVVMKELEDHRNDSQVGKLARYALADLDWLGIPYRVDGDHNVAEIYHIQNLIAGGRVLSHEGEHLGESELIVAARNHGASILIDDYDARVTAKTKGVTAISVHRLIHTWIRAGVVDSNTGKNFADAMKAENRGSDYTEQELVTGGRKAMGRVWAP